MKYDYDLICIGLGPAGMAISLMGDAMGLKVLAIEKHRIGGECMNVGCIPSKSILRYAKRVKTAQDLLGAFPNGVGTPFEKIQKHLQFIGDKKTKNLFDNVPVIFGKASFVDAHTITVNGENKSAKRIFIATGTRPALPKIAGADSVSFLTNETIFNLERVPASMIILGGGAIACEMAQAFARLGTKITLVQRSAHILSKMDAAAAEIVETKFRAEGINLLTGTLAKSVRMLDGNVELTTDKGEIIVAEKILAAAGRAFDFSELKLENAGVKIDEKRGNICVNKYLQTSQKNIFAVGDCNGHHLFSHAAMHQGMIALMNAMMPFPFKINFQKFVVPATMFTEPQVSEVGARERDLRERQVKFETIICNYGDYGAAIAEEVADGFIKVFVGRTGKILGAVIVGEGSGEMINEWALAVQKKLHITSILFLQHSFPTMGFLSKRIAETWTMGKMKSNFLKKLCRFFFRLG